MYLTQTCYYSRPYSKYLDKVKQTGKYIIYDKLHFNRGFARDQNEIIKARP